jgi:hypothetical protein
MNKIWSKYFSYVLAIVLILVLLWIVHKQIKEYHLQDDPMLYTLKEVLTPVMYNGKSITNGLKLYKGDKSFTINKSQTFLCLYDANGHYYPLNMLIYVLLHEISHSLNTKDIGHTEEFHRIFDDLLEQATKNGVYNPSIPIIQDYCNHE